MKPDVKLMAAIISAIDAYLQKEKEHLLPLHAESGHISVKKRAIRPRRMRIKPIVRLHNNNKRTGNR